MTHLPSLLLALFLDLGLAETCTTKKVAIGLVPRADLTEQGRKKILCGPKYCRLNIMSLKTDSADQFDKRDCFESAVRFAKYQGDYLEADATMVRPDGVEIFYDYILYAVTWEFNDGWVDDSNGMVDMHTDEYNAVLGNALSNHLPDLSEYSERKGAEIKSLFSRDLPILNSSFVFGIDPLDFEREYRKSRGADPRTHTSEAKMVVEGLSVFDVNRALQSAANRAGVRYEGYKLDESKGEVGYRVYGRDPMDIIDFVGETRKNKALVATGVFD